MNEIELAAGLPRTPNYRYADVIGHRLFIAGQVPRDSSGAIVGAGRVEVQTEQCLENLFALVQVHDFRRADIRHLTIYVVGPRERLSDAWSVVDRAFGSNVPPSTLLGVNCLGYADQLVEIDARVERVG